MSVGPLISRLCYPRIWGGPRLRLGPMGNLPHSVLVSSRLQEPVEIGRLEKPTPLLLYPSFRELRSNFYGLNLVLASKPPNATDICSILVIQARNSPRREASLSDGAFQMTYRPYLQMSRIYEYITCTFCSVLPIKSLISSIFVSPLNL